jgi:hypothetical protein
MRYFFLIIFYLLLAGCATLHIPQKPTTPGRIGLQLAPATLGKSISLQQHLIAHYADHKGELDTVLEIDPKHLSLVGLMFGQRILTLYYDGKTLKVWKNPRVPSQISGENILEDIELTLWPADVIQKALPIEWTIEEKNKQRIILLNNNPIIIINYLNKNTVILNNLRYHYQLTIQSSDN